MAEIEEYVRYTGKARLQKVVQSLLGLLEGVRLDEKVTPEEVEFIDMWIRDSQQVHHLHPFNELVPALKAAMADGVFEAEEHADLVWLCGRLIGEGYYDEVTADLQRFHGVLAGIIADGKVTAEELAGLSDWMSERPHLISCWPFDEVGAIVTHVMRDRVVTPEEQQTLLSFFANFIEIGDDRSITSPLVRTSEAGGISGLCAVAPEITESPRVH